MLLKVERNAINLRANYFKFNNLTPIYTYLPFFFFGLYLIFLHFPIFFA